MNTQVLTELGLSKYEVDVYLKLLELGSSTAIEVAKESKLHRPNVYDALSKLSKRGLVAYFLKGQIKYYEVIDPEQLVVLLKSKESKLQNLMPQLKLMQLNAKSPSSVVTLEGIVGARKILSDMAENSKEFYVLGVPKDIPKVIGEGWILEWHKKRIKNKVWFHHIVNEDYHIHRIKIIRSLKYTTIKFLPKEYNAPNSLFIYDKGIVLMFEKPLISIQVISEDVVKSFKAYYKMLQRIALDKAPQEDKP